MCVCLLQWDLRSGGLQSIGNGCVLQKDGLSAHFELYGFIFNDFHDFDDFAVVSGRRTLFPEGPRSLRDLAEGPGTLRGCVMAV